MRALAVSDLDLQRVQELPVCAPVPVRALSPAQWSGAREQRPGGQASLALAITSERAGEARCWLSASLWPLGAPRDPRGHLWQPPGGHCSCPPILQARNQESCSPRGPGGLSHPQPELLSVTWARGPPPSLLPARASGSLQKGTFTRVPQGPRGSVAQPPSRPRLSECPVGRGAGRAAEGSTLIRKPGWAEAQGRPPAHPPLGAHCGTASSFPQGRSLTRC